MLKLSVGGTHTDLFGIDGAVTCRCTTIRTWSPQQSTATPHDPQCFCIIPCWSRRASLSSWAHRCWDCRHTGSLPCGLWSRWRLTSSVHTPSRATLQEGKRAQGHSQRGLSSASWPLCPKQGSAKARVLSDRTRRPGA